MHKSINSQIKLSYCDYIDPFDCHSDPCHLAWIIRDHGELLRTEEILRKKDNYFKLNLECSNGTLFTDLNPNGFNHCPKIKNDILRK